MNIPNPYCRAVLAFVLLAAGGLCAKDAPEEFVRYLGDRQPDRYYYDGHLPHAVGVHSRQVFRANRTHPEEGGQVGFTYNHAPFLAYWNGQFLVHFLSGQVQEHTPPTRTMLVTSRDGVHWSAPQILFPEYELPEIPHEAGTIPAGTGAVMHQRMGFYVAPDGRLLALGFYSYCPTPRYSPNKGQGLGRVVREIYRDGSFGPIYFIRYNRHAGWNESNTRYPYYKTSDDPGFVAACEALLADKRMTLQWWEEDRGQDGFFIIDPSRVSDEDPDARQTGVTTSAGAGKAFVFYHLDENRVIGLWKNGYQSLSNDNGTTWAPIVKANSLWTCGAKTWGQRTADGRFALIYNHSVTRRNRFPLVVMTSANGQDFDDMLCVQGEVPPMRYQGIHKNPGPQYVRGIMEGNGDPPGDDIWITYSMNKEDIWVSRIPLPVSGTALQHINEDFQSVRDAAALRDWNLYVPKWAPVTIGTRGDNRYLELTDQAPYDYARVERIFPAAPRVTVSFRVFIAAVANASALEVEVQDRHGNRPMRLRFDDQWLGLDRGKIRFNHPLKIRTQQWYDIALTLDCTTQSYRLLVNGQVVGDSVAFAEPVASLERLVIRTGPYRGDVPRVIAEQGEPKTAGLYREDKPGAGEMVAPSRFFIDDVKTKGEE